VANLRHPRNLRITALPAVSIDPQIAQMPPMIFSAERRRSS
jgi:hypothetical protein